MSVLTLEARGMDFYEGCPEKNHSDLTNFRYYTEVWLKDEYFPKKFYIEISTHFDCRKSKVRTYVEVCEYKEDGIMHRVPELCGYCEPTKAELIKKINSISKNDFDEIDIRKDSVYFP